MDVRLLVFALSLGLSDTHPPSGWVEVRPPNANESECALRSRVKWHVEAVGKEVRLVQRRSGGPVVPPPIARHESVRGWPIRFAVPVSDGYLIGSNKGEWGGWIRWYSKNGRKWSTVAAALPVAMEASSDGAITVVGFDSVLATSGFVATIARRRGEDWRVVARSVIQGVPRAAVRWREGMLIATPTAMLAVDMDGANPRVILDLREQAMPESLAVVHDGEVWFAAGMHAAKVTFGPDGEVTGTHWFVRLGCEVTHWEDHSLCACGEAEKK